MEINKVVEIILNHYLNNIGRNTTSFIIDDAKIDENHDLFVIFESYDNYIDIQEIIIFDKEENKLGIDLQIIDIEQKINEFLQLKIA